MPGSIKDLLQKLSGDQFTEADEQELLQLLQDNQYKDQIIAAIQELMSEQSSDENFDEQRYLPMLQQILSADKPSGVVRKFYWWRRIAVAASIVGLLLVAGYWLFVRRESGVGSRESSVVSRESSDVKAPQSNRAMITLADGRTVYLDSVGSGQLAVEGSVKLVKLQDGKISYQLPVAGSQLAVGGEQLAVRYNTLTNPRGSKVIDMTLSDGSHVWLNAGSSITYPVAFIGNERKIIMTGEADFVVAHNEKIPFKVIANGVEVKDIGTEFNVNAYDDEDAIKVTLLEGAVDVSRPSSAKATEGKQESGVLIKPGEQAVVIENGKLRVENNIDVEQVMAWKNGKFDFGQSTGLQEIMKQISRWYDVDIEYSEKFDQDFGGSVGREVNVSQVLNKFELTGRVHFKIEGKKITVTR